MTVAVLVDTDQLDREALAEIGTACARVRASVVPLREARDTISASALIVGALRRGERRISQALVDLMQQYAPGASVLLMSDEPLIRPAVATHNGRVTLLARPATPARIRGTVRMLLAQRGALSGEHIDAHAWSAVASSTTSTLPAPAVRHDPSGGLTAVFALEPGWSGAEDLCLDVDLIAQARIDEDERYRRLREILGSAAGAIHLAPDCRQWVAYWPSTRSPLLLCSPLRLPRVCNITEAASKNLLTLVASPGDLVVALAREPAGGPASYAGVNLADGGAAFLEELEAASSATMPGLVVELR